MLKIVQALGQVPVWRGSHVTGLTPMVVGMSADAASPAPAPNPGGGTPTWAATPTVGTNPDLPRSGWCTTELLPNSAMQIKQFCVCY